MLVKSPSIAILFDAGCLHRRSSSFFSIVLIISDRVMSLIDSFNVFVVLVDMDTLPIPLPHSAIGFDKTRLKLP